MDNENSRVDVDLEDEVGQPAETEPSDAVDTLSADFLQAVLEGMGKENERLAHEKERLQADFDNYRRRTERERESLAIFANESLVKALLPVLDNLDRAMAAAPAGDDNPVVSGVILVRRQLFAALERVGLSEVESVGKPFDPNLHEAIGEVTADGVENDVIVDEFQKGYVLGGRLLRASMVRIARS